MPKGIPVAFENPPTLLKHYWQRYPFRAANDGLHEFDGQVGRWDQASLDDYVRSLNAFAPGPEHDTQLIYLYAQSERFWYQELGWHTVCPMVYLEPVDPSLYLKRNYAPENLRRQSAAAHARQLPDLLNRARTHLSGPTSASMYRQAAASMREYAEFYAHEVHDFCQSSAALRAAEALHDFSLWMDEKALKAPDHYAMGQANFERLLEVTQGVALAAEEVEALAWLELERNLARGQELTRGHLQSAASEASHQHLVAEEVLDGARSILDGLRQFLEQKQLVELPQEARVQVCLSPPGARWSFASMDSPGPFEASDEAFYYITLPDPGWPAADREEWLSAFEPGLLRMISLHEAIPGHYLHHLRNRNLPSDARKALRSYTFTEGWAHYCEEMMVEVGYDGGLAPGRLELSQVLAALDRCCRLIASLRLHCGGETPDQVARLFREKAMMEPARSLCSARRGAFDPEYGDYTLGKLMLRKLRADQPELSLRQFHDQILGWGAPPPWLLRRTLGVKGTTL